MLLFGPDRFAVNLTKGRTFYLWTNASNRAVMQVNRSVGARLDVGPVAPVKGAARSAVVRMLILCAQRKDGLVAIEAKRLLNALNYRGPFKT